MHFHSLFTFSGLNPALADSSLTSISDAFKLFFDDELVGKICEWVNERATKFLAEHPDRKGCMNSARGPTLIYTDSLILHASLQKG